MGSGKSPTVILNPDSTNTSPATTNRKGGYRGGEPLLPKDDQTTRSIDRVAQIATIEQKNCFPSKQEAFEHRQT